MLHNIFGSMSNWVATKYVCMSMNDESKRPNKRVRTSASTLKVNQPIVDTWRKYVHWVQNAINFFASFAIPKKEEEEKKIELNICNSYWWYQNVLLTFVVFFSLYVFRACSFLALIRFRFYTHTRKLWILITTWMSTSVSFHFGWKVKTTTSKIKI